MFETGPDWSFRGQLLIFCETSFQLHPVFASNLHHVTANESQLGFKEITIFFNLYSQVGADLKHINLMQFFGFFTDFVLFGCNKDMGSRRCVPARVKIQARIWLLFL